MLNLNNIVLLFVSIALTVHAHQFQRHQRAQATDESKAALLLEDSAQLETEGLQCITVDQYGRTSDKWCNENCLNSWDGNFNSHPACTTTSGRVRRKDPHLYCCCGVNCPVWAGKVSPVNCAGTWSAYGTCSKTCGGGQQYRTYGITKNAAHGGSGCPASNGQTQSQSCSAQDCPVAPSDGATKNFLLFAVDRKCPYKHHHRLWRMAKANAQQCALKCLEDPTCVAYSINEHEGTQYFGVCMGCTATETNEGHKNFNFYFRTTAPKLSVEMVGDAIATTQYAKPAALVPPGFTITDVNAACEQYTKEIGGLDRPQCSELCASEPTCVGFSLGEAGSDSVGTCRICTTSDTSQNNGWNQFSKDQLDDQSGGVSGDPHFLGFDGSRFDFNGQAGSVYTLISDRHFQLNAKMGLNKVDGLTYITMLGVTIGDNFLAILPHTVRLGRMELPVGPHSLSNTEGGHIAVVDVGRVHAKQNHRCTIHTLGWTISIEAVRWHKHTDLASAHLNLVVSCNRNHITNPHGILGQTAQFLIQGKAPHPMQVETEDGEGFLEGAADDYKVTRGLMGRPHRFDRFDAPKQNFAHGGGRIFAISKVFQHPLEATLENAVLEDV